MFLDPSASTSITIPLVHAQVVVHRDADGTMPRARV